MMIMLETIIGDVEIKTKSKDVEIVAPLKHLSNFWRTLDMH